MKKTTESPKYQLDEVRITEEELRKQVSEYKARYRKAKLHIRVDKNLVEYPIASYNKKTKENWVRLISDDGETISEIGSPDGCWTAFDKKVFDIGIMRFTHKMTESNLLLSWFTYSQLREALNEDVSTQRLIASIKKIVTTHIRHQQFVINQETSKKYWQLDGLPFTQRYVLIKSGEQGRCLIVWNSFLAPNFTRYYHKLNYSDYKRVKSPIEWRIYEYLSHKLWSNRKYAEHWEKLCRKIPITTTNTSRRLEILVKHLKILPQFGINYIPQDPRKIREKGIIWFKRTKYFKGYVETKEEENPTLEEELRAVFIKIMLEEEVYLSYPELKTYFVTYYPEFVNLTTFNKEITPKYLQHLREAIQKEEHSN